MQFFSIKTSAIKKVTAITRCYAYSLSMTESIKKAAMCSQIRTPCKKVKANRMIRYFVYCTLYNCYAFSWINIGFKCVRVYTLLENQIPYWNDFPNYFPGEKSKHFT